MVSAPTALRRLAAGTSAPVTVDLGPLEELMQGAPTLARQLVVARALGRLAEPIVKANNLPEYVLRPGFRLRRRWGQCKRFADGRLAEIQVRCVDGAPPAWRPVAGLVATLLHELAHLRYGGHGSRFWQLHRRLMDQAAAIGLYAPLAGDPVERSQGDEKLGGSAGEALADAARARRRERAAVNREAAARWRVGDHVRIMARGRLLGAEAVVLAVARSWVTVQTRDKHLYRVIGTALAPAEMGSEAVVNTG
jgi:hypothetical protein